MPVGFKSFGDAGIRLRAGQFSLWAAGPGTGKSTIALNYMIKAMVSTMYYSADSDAFVQLSRAVARLKGWTFDRSMRAVLDGRDDEYIEALNGMPFRFSYEPDPTLDDIETELRAYLEIYGEYPRLIVVDNVTNVIEDSGSDDKLNDVVAFLDSMSRKTQAHVAGMHHVKAEYNAADKPIPLDGVKDQITGKPAAVYTIHRRPGDEWTRNYVGISNVKQRVGPSDPSGQTFVELEFQADKALILDPSEAS